MPTRRLKPWYRDIIDRLSKKYNKDPRVMEYIVHYPFSFLKSVISDEYNTKAVRLRHLGVFYLKHSQLKDIISQRQRLKLWCMLELLVEVGEFESVEEARHVIGSMDRASLRKLYEQYVTK